MTAAVLYNRRLVIQEAGLELVSQHGHLAVAQTLLQKFGVASAMSLIAR